MIISIFTPHGGCPERCGFCDQKTSGGTPIRPLEIEKIIEEHLSSYQRKENPFVEVAFYGGTFTALRKELQIQMLDVVSHYQKKGFIDFVRISTRPDCIEENWISEIAQKYKIKTIELGVQSFNSTALKNLGRSHLIDHVNTAVAVLKKLGIEVGLHLLLGVPGERLDEDKQTLKEVLRLNPNHVRIHPLLVLEGTELVNHYKRGLFIPIDLEVAVERACFLTQHLETAGIRVIRLGLQENDLLATKVVAGPHDPGFGGRVRGRILRNRIESKILEEFHDIDLTGQVLTLSFEKRDFGRISGPRKENLEWLKSRFGFSRIVLKDQTHEAYQIRISHSHRSSECRQIKFI